ncbi:MAG: molybdate ABC transporter substrate-binding protein [Treponema sp.]|jgi:molybdate transport system substrate-binding protein|nr:molybdate ABC transporter substrate-binding protein [Treponema sp.]
MRKWTFRCILIGLVVSILAGTPLFAGGKKEAPAGQAGVEGTVRDTEAPVTILVAAAASLRNAFDQEIIPRFRAAYPWISVEGTYDSSGKLQTQIEQGLEADVFMAAAMTQMDNLVKGGLVQGDMVRSLLENKVVLIKPVGVATVVTGFQDISAAPVIALGDPASVPAGQYAQEIFTSLGTWDVVKAKASLGTNVTEVLNWVAEASAEVGVVYATDAASSGKVEVLAEAPAGSLARPVIYPVAPLAASLHPEEARLFIDFLASSQGLAVFAAYGFAAAP